jgi:alpha-tubulin suppressor-like RCC1 family protein
MKTSFGIYIAVVFSLNSGGLLYGAPTGASQRAPAVPPPTAYSVVGRDANSRVWERTTYELSPFGIVVPQKHRYTELATGLHYQKNGQWVESKEEIDILPNGTAAATQGQHQAYFPGNIYQGVIKLVTPDGIHLQSRPLGLSYDDGTKSVLIAELKHSTGELVGSNQVIYPDAFTDFKADLRYTYTKAGFEQDIVLREQPPSPEAYGLNPETARLQVLTEFFNAPEPVTTKPVANRQNSLGDTTLAFGTMKMIQGKAFAVGDQLPTRTRSRGIPVAKSWQHLSGRTFLVEELPVQKIERQLEQLPVPANAGTTLNLPNSIRHKISVVRLLPPVRLVQASTNAIQLAKADSIQKHGVVLDYVTINSGETNYTFQGDTTYYVGGEYNLSGTTTFEGGTVIKLDGSGQIDIDVNGTINCQTGPYRPAVFTSINDNSVGEQFGSGSPAFGDVGIFLNIDATNASLHDLRFSYSWVPINQGWGSSPAVINVWDCQFEDVDVAIYGYNIGLHNVLIGRSFNSDAAVFVEGTNMVGENVTADGGSAFLEVDGSGAIVALTNCLVTGQPLITGNPVTLLTNATVWLESPSSPVYQTVGAGSYYLTNDSPYRNGGTTNIDPDVLAGIRTKTTYPPIVYSNTTISTPMTFSPQARRDTDISDLGYHYDPIDYVFGGVGAASNLTFTAGTAVGWFELPGSGGSGYGISLPDSSTATFNGTVTLPCVLTRYDTVQEGGNGLWTDKGWLAAIVAMGDTPSDASLASQAKATFTHFAALANDPNYVRDYTSDFVLQANDCEFWSGDQGGYGIHLYLTNCLINGCYLGIQAISSGDSALVMRNCTMREGGILTTHWGDATWPTWIENCVFERTDLSQMDDPSGSNTNITYCDFNAFVTNQSRLPVLGAQDVILTNFNWQSSWLGNYYLPTNSWLINAGSTTADAIGIYHFTTQTNQVKETNSIVDIGYHYVAVDQYGNPIDSNSDGIPDYLEDANGNGLVDNGESPWMPPPTITAQPQNTTVILGATTNFTVTASGIGFLSYQWLQNGFPLSDDGMHVIGAATPTLTLTNVLDTDSTTYQVVVSNPDGSTNSSAVTLTVLDPPTITAQPVNVMTNQGGTATFSVMANGTSPLSYQWQKNGSNLNNNDNVSGANYSTLTLTSLTPWDAGIYTVVVSNAAGSVTSLYAVLRDWTPSGVVAWGYDGHGQTDVPSGLTNVVAIAAGGSDFSLALNGDGTVVGWGSTTAPSGLTNVVAIAAGWDHGLALKGDGTAVAWGDDYFGESDVPTGLSNVVAVAAGWSSSLALKSDGTVVPWGQGVPGFLSAPAGLTNVVGIAAGDMYCMALKGDSTIAYWGRYPNNKPPTGLTNVAAIASGLEHSLALKEDGTVVAWGDNYYGECNVPSDLTNAVAIAGSYYGSLALKADGTVVAWGNMNVPSGLTNVIAIAEGSDSFFAGDFSLALVNIPPVITTQPQNQTVTAGANVTFNVTATGIPLNYQWYFNGVPLAGATSATLTLANVQSTNAGNYFVRVFNSAGSVFSTTAGLTVLFPPTINLTSPTNGQFFNAYPTNLTLTATAGDVDGNVVSVAFYNGANLLGSNTTSPYTLTWNGVIYGSYALTACATDDSGLMATSSVVNITVDGPPAVSVTSPVNSTTIITPTNLTVSATASDSDGTVTQLQIFAGTNLLGTSGTSPFSLVWSNVPPGTWNLTAVATDNLGAIGTSSVVTLTANPSTNLPAIADAHVRDGSSYSNLNYGTVSVMEVQTSTGTGTNRDAYFKFDVSNLSSNISSAKLSVFAAVSTNGIVTNTVYSVTNTSWVETDITWSNKPARGAALSTNNVSGTNGSWYLYDVTGFIRSQKTAGSNWISLALHDPTNTTRLININSRENTSNNPALIVVTTNPPPTVSITSPTNNTVYLAPAGSITINATAGDDGSVGQVQFFQGTTSLGVVTTPPYSVTWNNVAAGTYALKAVATDNYGLAATSSVVNVIVDIPPTVTLTNPANNSVFVAGTNVTLGAMAADADGTVKQVQFFQGTVGLGTDTNAPFGLTWNNATAGIYALTVVATDNNGITSTSAPVNIIVDALPMILITNPVSSTSFTSPTNITIAATASNSDGTMPQVQFFVGGILLGTCTNQPYGAIWTNPPVGKFVLTAVATDDYGLVATATVTNITVGTNLPAIADAHVRDGSSYSNLNFGTASVMEVQTSTGTGTGTNRDAYFKFDISNLSSNISSARLNVFATVSTNGIVTNTVYAVINTSWVETTITWSNRPARGAALSTNNVSGTNGSWYLYDVTGYIRSQRTAGSNWVSLALHDPTNTTRLININSRENASNNPALIVITTNRSPNVSIASPTNTAVLSITTNLTISATASDSVGIYQVQFFQGTNTSLGVVTTPPYSVTWNNPLTGIYALTAVATDNAGLTTTSSVVNVTLTFIVDSDGDGISDLDEINIYHTDPLVPNSAIPSSISVQTCPQ